MRVLMLSKACLVGIYQRKLEEIAKHPAVTELKVLVPPSWRDERGEVKLERVYTDGYTLQETPIRLNGYFHLHYYPEFPKAIRAFQPDILHIDEEPYNLATWLALRAARRIGAKSLFFSWQNLNRTYPLPVRLMEKWVFKHIDYAIAGTQSAAEVWRQKGYKGRMAVIPQFGVDTHLFSATRKSNHVLRIGYVGRLVAEKNVDILLRALAALMEYQWSLHIVGSGPEEAALKNLTQALRLMERVFFTGWLPSVEMPAYFQNLDVLVVPSRTMPNWKEQFGRVIVEAMASKVAVVGSDSGAIPDVVDDAGLIFREGDAEDLAHQLRKLLINAELRCQLAEKGRQHVLENFTQEQIAARTVAVYQEMLR